MCMCLDFRLIFDCYLLDYCLHISTLLISRSAQGQWQGSGHQSH